jgi:hypothetical protein
MLLLHASCQGSLLGFLFLAAEHLKKDYQQRYEGRDHQDVYQRLEKVNWGHADFTFFIVKTCFAI